ncbi:Pyruvate/Phosphoenolpyruvate kinase-like domain-containing protein [Mrakia frigida]|uniref:HpcH/HpaI aldolase/citrate lyase family protein n=1 Tax=Mrakia frigida TaxID=29902 RepID=UPI003FCC24CB
MVSFTRILFHQRSQALSTIKATGIRPLRSLLYVPCSSPKFLAKSLEENVASSDTIIYDLEDSVPISRKKEAREDLVSFLKANPYLKTRLAVRINAVGSGFEEDDLASIFSIFPSSPSSSNFTPLSPLKPEDHSSTPPLPVIVIPKVDHPAHLSKVASLIKEARGRSAEVGSRVPLIASVESAESLWNVGDIAGWRGEGCQMSGLLFAAEDFCASTSILRSPSRVELLYARSRIVMAAKAFNIAAVDMVCINYKDENVLKEECEEGRRLGFDGKQAIHPAQISRIQSSFSPSLSEIHRATRILEGMEAAELENKGAFGLDLGGGKAIEMIDEPMVKAAKRVVQVANLLGMTDKALSSTTDTDEGPSPHGP